MESRVLEFKEYMVERHAMYLRRQNGIQPPWTRDEALKKIYLTNVFRELDTVTQWIREYIREPFEDSPHLWFMILASRLLNWPPTLQHLLNERAFPVEGVDHFDQELFTEILEERVEGGLKVFGNAYILTNGGKKMPKYQFTGEILEKAWRERGRIEPRLHNTLEQATNVLKTLPGIGGFIGYEVACDLRYTRYLREAPDVLTWAHAGPGAKRGLNWVYGREPVTKSIPENQAVKEMRELFDYVREKWPYSSPRLEMREIEHSLCEFAKVCAYRYLGKRPKRFYRPEK